MPPPAGVVSTVHQAESILGTDPPPNHRRSASVAKIDEVHGVFAAVEPVGFYRSMATVKVHHRRQMFR
jgi:hypothetical protein